MKIGPLRHLVTLQVQGTEARDSYGGRTTPWIDAGQAWAELNPYRLREQVTLRRRNGEDVVGLRVRAPQAAVAIGRRVVVEGVPYEIVEVDRSRAHRGELGIIGKAETTSA